MLFLAIVASIALGWAMSLHMVFNSELKIMSTFLNSLILVTSVNLVDDNDF